MQRNGAESIIEINCIAVKWVEQSKNAWSWQQQTALISVLVASSTNFTGNTRESALALFIVLYLPFSLFALARISLATHPSLPGWASSRIYAYHDSRGRVRGRFYDP